MLHEQEPSYESRWAALTSIAGKIGCTAETLRKWVQRAEIDDGQRPGRTSSEHDELKALKRENRELKRANEILKTASAFFAQAELDRRLK
jgi:transposase-like protein